MWNYNSCLPFHSSSQEKNRLWKEFWLEKNTLSWSEMNSGAYQKRMTEVRVVTYFDKKLHHVCMVLNTPLMMAVARNWESTSNKTKILFRILANKTQSTFVLDNMGVPTIWMMVQMLEKSWKHEYLDET